MIKNILIAIGLASTISVASAASTTVNTPAGIVPTVLVSNSCRSVQFIFSNTNLLINSIHTIFDAPASTTVLTNTATVAAFVGTTITNILPSYTYVSLSSTLVTNVYTNYFGVVYNTNVQYTAIVHTTNTVAQTTNTYPVALTIIVPTNSTLQVDFNQTFTRGILDTNNGAGTVTTVYTQ